LDSTSSSSTSEDSIDESNNGSSVGSHKVNESDTSEDGDYLPCGNFTNLSPASPYRSEEERHERKNVMIEGRVGPRATNLSQEGEEATLAEERSKQTVWNQEPHKGIVRGLKGKGRKRNSPQTLA
jgi:hypothetical protein